MVHYTRLQCAELESTSQNTDGVFPYSIHKDKRFSEPKLLNTKELTT